MGAGINADSIADLIASTMKDLGRGKVTDLTSDLQDHVAMRQLLKDHKISFKAAGIKWNIRTAHNNSARNVGLFGTDNVNVGDALQTAEIPWRHTTWDWAIERREIAVNQGSPEEIVDLVKERRMGGMISGVEFMEAAFWNKPPDSTDTLIPFGIPYWIVKNATEGFNGGNPAGFAAGCGGKSSVTYPRWANWSAQYVNVTKEDLVRKLRKASVKTQFRAPVEGITPDYNTGDKYGYYTNYDVIGSMEEILEDQNDNLGKDVASMDGQVMFRRRPMIWVPYLDNDTTDPVYGINWGVFKVAFLKGEFMREDGPSKAAGQHSVYVTFVDTSWNPWCTDRRRLFVISK